MIRCLRPFGYKMLLFAFHNPPAGLTSSIDDISSNSRPSRLPGFYNSQSHLLNRLLVYAMVHFSVSLTVAIVALNVIASIAAPIQDGELHTYVKF